MYLGYVGVDVSSLVKRFGIVRADNGGVESGACYPGCAPADIGACKPMSFPSQAAFNQYAQSHGEWPQILGTAIPDSPTWNDLRQQAFGSCGAIAGPVPAAAAPTLAPGLPIYVPPPGATPTASGGSFQIPVRAPSPTPATPQPIFITTPGSGAGPVYIPTPVTTTGDTAAGEGLSLPLLIGGGLVLLLLARR